MDGMKILAVGLAAVLATALFVVIAAPALAANDAWNGREVRIVFDAEGAPVAGRVTRTGGCLYVKLDAPRDGLTLIRLDQVRRLETRGATGWTAQDVKAALAREPAQCLEEANG